MKMVSTEPYKVLVVVIVSKMVSAIAEKARLAEAFWWQYHKHSDFLAVPLLSAQLCSSFCRIPLSGFGCDFANILKMGCVFYEIYLVEVHNRKMQGAGAEVHFSFIIY